jgi:hypothetical protein
VLFFDPSYPECHDGNTPPLNPDISCYARNANSLERRLAVGFTVTMTLKAD